jgi:hypothetical protein
MPGSIWAPPFQSRSYVCSNASSWSDESTGGTARGGAWRDIYLFEDGGAWLVEGREGGAEGRSKWYDFKDENAAIECVRGLMVGPGEWRELH